MNIKSISAHPLRYPEPHDHGAIRHITLARVEAEDGTVGWGECISQFPDSCQATKIVIEQGYAPMLIGESAIEVEARWHQMVDRVWWYGPQGIAAFAISAVDMALWDLKGKLLGLPVCNRINTRIGTGEQEWNLDGYRRLLEAGGVDVVQIDPGRCQGITGSVKAVRLIEAANLSFSAHTWSSALNTAASVHLLASSLAGHCMDFKPHESPMQHELVSDPWTQKDSLIAVRDAPGLGVTVNEATVKEYSF